MSRLHIQNWSHESATDCAWTTESVELSSGNLLLDRLPIGTYFAACYPESERPAQFIVNLVDASGKPVMSVPFECIPGHDLVRPIEASDSPWSEDGVLVGPIPNEAERSSYTRAIEAVVVAKELVGCEPNLVSYHGEA
jgi:hypothetical protein